jgi:hypothetical protein
LAKIRRKRQGKDLFYRAAGNKMDDAVFTSLQVQSYSIQVQRRYLIFVKKCIPVILLQKLSSLGIAQSYPVIQVPQPYYPTRDIKTGFSVKALN